LRNLISSLPPKDDLRYETCQSLAQVIEKELGSSAEPLRRAIVTVLEYDGGDIEEYMLYLCAMIALLPKPPVDAEGYDIHGHRPGDVDNEGNSLVFGRSY